MSSYGNGNILKVFDILDQVLPASGIITTPFIDVSEFNNFNAVSYNNSSSLTIDFRFSIDGLASISDSLLVSTVSASSANLTDQGNFLIEARYMNATLTGTVGKTVSLQLVFNNKAPGLSHLVNVGSGVAIFASHDEMKTITSNDGSVTVSSTATEVDVSAGGLPDPSSAGGTSIIKTPSTNIFKGLVGGTSCTLVSNTNDVTINVVSPASTVWQESAAQISPQTASTSLLGGCNTANCSITTSSTNSVVLGGTTNTISHPSGGNFGYINNAIIAGNTNNFDFNGDRLQDSVIIGGDSNSIKTATTTNGRNLYRCAIIAGETNAMSGGCVNSAMIGGTGNIMAIGSSSCILGGVNCEIKDVTTTASTFKSDGSCILGGTGNQIHMWNGRRHNSVILGGTSNTMKSAVSAPNIFDCAILSGNNNAFLIPSGANGQSSTIIGGENNFVRDSENSVIIGNYCDAQGGQDGCVLVGDSATTTLQNSASNQYSSRFSGGYRLFTNAAQSTGMTMGANLSAWSAVSDINKKDIQREVDYNSYLEKMRSIPVYEYNYKSCCSANRNIGPVAQDWNNVANFRTPDNIVNVFDEETGEQIFDIEGLPVTENKGAFKDPLRICQGDEIGVLLSCVKGLLSEIDQLKARINILETINNI
jgi:hypothetical protein